ncbi:MAG: hypothetical protein HC837_19845 [Chloroflexaceae bacterium]|nr:hypothetical protein [Chloroflexaceae bacterium]
MLPVLAGLALTSLALNARAGPFFVLPALLIWGCLVFRGRSRISLTLLVAGIGAIVLGFAANMLVLRVVGSPSGQPFSNFAYNLYGLVVGGAQWRQVLVDHPELASLVEPALSQQIYALTWQAFLSNPLGPLIGAVRIWASLFYPGGGFGSGGGAFSFIYGHPVAGDTLIALLVRLVAFAGSGWGAWQCYRQRQKPVCSLLLAALVGLLLSVPFVPPMIDPYAMRAYAAFMPMVVTLATLGTLWLWQHLSRTRQAALWDSADPQRRSSAGLLIGAVLLMGWVVLGPIAVKALSQAPQITAPPPCAAGQESLVVPIYAGSAVTLQAEQATPTLPTLVVPLDAFRAGVPDSGWNWRPEFVEALRSLEGDQTLVVTFDRHADDPPVLLVVATQLLPPTASLVHVCGQQPPESELFFVTSLEPVTP